MKKSILILLLFIGFNSFAQNREKRNYTPEQHATLSTKKMTLALDLNESQQTKIYNLNLDNAKVRKAKMEEFKTLRKSDENKRLSSDERYKKESEMLDHKIAQKEKMKSILSKEQFEKWEKMMLHQKGRNKKNSDNKKSSHKNKDRK
ncbi:hypothetical protein H0I23_11540 [Cellulophaga sp. HaHaR_3_176]|uniref:hypothetical protein n=1 Tax=Cellulophaga sp. HaHaR_3_176 TaxID=1942464 RepID=UPI001C1FDB3C|nr:hypothetical protein [Cellulophaga sp. HaHaR_3_176]QWX83084.1 hypothetical protein H0I23_11540 [Cellulophaga sp. HaHaR_3_176]